MGIKGTLKKIVERLTGTHIFRDLPRGISIFSDISRALPRYRVDVIFDVGANIGQSARSYIALSPSSKVYCFEPVAETYRQLAFNMKEETQVRCFRLAFGATRAIGSMLTVGTSTMNHLLDERAAVPANDDEIRTEQVEIMTLDDFCNINGVGHINYLKVDTEGGDLDVLKGAVNMLAEQSVDFIEVEVGMNPKNKYHVPFEDIKDYLEQHGYFLFGIYEQVHEWPTKELHLRRSNPVFVSTQMISRHKII